MNSASVFNALAPGGPISKKCSFTSSLSKNFGVVQMHSEWRKNAPFHIPILKNFQGLHPKPPLNWAVGAGRTRLRPSKEFQFNWTPFQKCLDAPECVYCKSLIVSPYSKVSPSPVPTPHFESDRKLAHFPTLSLGPILGPSIYSLKVSPSSHLDLLSRPFSRFSLSRGVMIFFSSHRGGHDFFL